MAILKELKILYGKDAKVRVTENWETNNTCNKIGYILNIHTPSKKAHIIFDSGQNVKYTQWLIPFRLIYPEVMSFLDIR